MLIYFEKPGDYFVFVHGVPFPLFVTVSEDLHKRWGKLISCLEKSTELWGHDVMGNLWRELLTDNEITYAGMNDVVLILSDSEMKVQTPLEWGGEWPPFR